MTDMITRLGQLVRQMREATGLSLTQLSMMTGLTTLKLQELEQGGGELPSFDICRKLGQAFSAKTGYQFVLHDIWLACSVDKYFSSRSQLDEQNS
jgi:transcriptional regulator with XRE-family HTH domain